MILCPKVYKYTLTKLSLSIIKEIILVFKFWITQLWHLFIYNCCANNITQLHSLQWRTEIHLVILWNVNLLEKTSWTSDLRSPLLSHLSAGDRGHWNQQCYHLFWIIKCSFTIQTLLSILLRTTHRVHIKL